MFLSSLARAIVLNSLFLFARAHDTYDNTTTVVAYPFDLNRVTLGEGRFMENQNRTLNYLNWVDVDRMLYVFRETHGLSTEGALNNSGWDAPDFPFRSHVQGHFLTAWAQCYATSQDSSCKDRAQYFVAELAKCQNNSGGGR